MCATRYKILYFWWIVLLFVHSVFNWPVLVTNLLCFYIYYSQHFINCDSSILQHGWTALMWAVVGEVESVRKILSFPDVNVNLRDQVCCLLFYTIGGCNILTHGPVAPMRCLSVISAISHIYLVNFCIRVETRR